MNEDIIKKVLTIELDVEDAIADSINLYEELVLGDDVDEESYFIRHTPPPRKKIRNVGVQCDLVCCDLFEVNLLDEFSVVDPFDMA
jgi:hypothetical protein